ncbi:MAG: high-potential iron-sulfur protein [Novosphingobium sp.]|nr:high-potential iron-sulfur protein [Novosphingobium sp.]
MNDTRRKFLALAGLSPLMLLGARGAFAADAACYDADALPFSQKSRRRSVGYVEKSTDPVKHCGACSFFTGTQADCGNCQILGGPVKAEAVCNSFALKAK